MTIGEARAGADLLVSTVIPVYNGARYLAAAIDSVLAQTYRPLEIIVVDDGSTDNSAEIARSYPDVRCIYQSNQGHGQAKNTGLATARGEFIAFLDADDLWTPDKLAVQVGYLLQHPQVDYVLAHMRVFLEPGVVWPPWLNQDHYMSDPVGFLPGTLVARRAVFARTGGFDVSYRHANDSDWFFRARDTGVPMAVLPDVLLHRRIHSANLSHETRAVTEELLRALNSSLRRKRSLE